REAMPAPAGEAKLNGEARAPGGPAVDGGFMYALVPPAPPPPLLVREFAHLHPTDPSGVRSDFAETLYWHPALVLIDGKAEVSFDLNDSVTSFQVAVCGHTVD